MIHFLTGILKWPQHHSIYWALEDMRTTELMLGQPMAYWHVTRDTNCIVDDIASWEQAITTLWDG